MVLLLGIGVLGVIMV